ncbi:MAG: Cof-type HAD-IIB family hydrolase [Spirochaetaceae bacterium]|jgi:hydroxymethylpyrimidine pyrophosphatase-like HAD family hydrolase|nr:Cof-type HAD-IIB family hydrolase [Spirochaetaceae bacterium]
MKIIFLDIDGTLSDINYVPPSAKRACRAARRNGHLLYICTGRTRSQIRRSILKIGFDGVISSGGAYVETGAGKLLFQAAIGPDALCEIIDYFDARKTAYTLELSDGQIAGPHLKSYFSNRYAGKSWTIARLVETIFMRQIFKDCVWNSSGGRDRMDIRNLVFWESGGVTFEEVSRVFGEKFEMFRLSIPLPGMCGGEMGPPGVHKGAAAEKVVEYHGLRREDVIAFGDSDNDRTMIEYAGMGIAMGNAAEDLKKIAGDVTASVRGGGIEKAFKKYRLI